MIEIEVTKLAHEIKDIKPKVRLLIHQLNYANQTTNGVIASVNENHVLVINKRYSVHDLDAHKLIEACSFMLDTADSLKECLGSIENNNVNVDSSIVDNVGISELV